ncbi:MAG: energy transducer TonB [Sulfuritalea sp.]|jgi:protein TonB|nr:energy transducer TonB [Sulfuritalea sp.]
MPLYIALLLSLALHAALIVGPAWLVAAQRPLPTAGIEARLMPRVKPVAMAEALSTEASSTDDATPLPLVAPPRKLAGSALRRAQSALSEHLFYPPEAVARGLEGDVILLLILADNGQLVSASIARSSGHALLDQAALDAAQRIGALPGNPRQTLFPVSFRLQ